METEAALKTVLAIPFAGLIFSVLASMMAILIRAFRPRVTGRWGEAMDSLIISWNVSFALLELASALETLIAVLVLVIAVASVLRGLVN